VNTQRAKWLIRSLAVVALLFLAVSAWSNFNNYQAGVYPADPSGNHLADVGTSDGGVTAWTYGRYYGPPARSTYGLTGAYSSGVFYPREEYGWETRTYISTGALFSSSTNSLCMSLVNTDYSNYTEVQSYASP